MASAIQSGIQEVQGEIRTMARILIVEDEVIITIQLEERLKKMGYEVVGRARSGQEALKIARSLNPDLILMDIIMPGDMDGIEAAEKIRKELDIPVIFLTSYADDALINRAKKAEPFGYILKPYQEYEIKAVIELSLHKRNLERKIFGEPFPFKKDHLAFALKTIEEGFITTDLQGKTVLINDSAEKLTGWKKEEAFGKKLNDIFGCPGKNEQETIEKIVESVIRTGQVTNTDICLLAKNGEKRSIALSCVPIRDAKKNIGVIVVFRDISGARKKEEEILKKKRLESIAILAEGIAHSFNNILTAVLLNLDGAKSMVRVEDESYARLVGAETASYRVKELIQKLLFFSKGEPAVRRKQALVPLIRKSASNVLRKTKLDCEYNLPDDLWEAEVDERQITSVLDNLLINAGEAMPQGGLIRISAENMTLGSDDHSFLGHGKYIRLTIEDQGIGIPKDNLPMIFDPFFTTKAEVGRGLGLSSVHSIIKGHDGYVDVESEPGIGTKVYLYLPALL
jgi:PAS domain S-box-containing protein